MKTSSNESTSFDEDLAKAVAASLESYEAERK